MNSKYALKQAVVGAALLISATASQAVTFDLENSFNGWLSSLQGIGPTTIGTGTFVASPSNPNVPVVQGVAGLSFTANGGSVLFQNNAGIGTLVNNLGAGNYLEWSLPSAQNGWGGTFAIDNGNTGVAFSVNDINLGWIDVCGPAACFGNSQAYSGFFGFTTTDRFTGVRAFAGPGNPIGSSYSMTDVSIGYARSSAVPEPGSLALLALAGGLLAFSRRLRST